MALHGEVFDCAGTVAKYVESGYRATCVMMTTCKAIIGEDLWAEELSNYEKTASILGADFQNLEFEGGGVFECDLQAKVKVAEKIRELRPDILVTQPYEGVFQSPHIDHQYGVRLVWYGRWLASYEAPGILSTTYPPHFANDFYFMGDCRPEGRGGEKVGGLVYIDISDVIDKVIKARLSMRYDDFLIKIRGAQPDVWSSKDILNDEEFAKCWKVRSAEIGGRCGVKYAECFTPCLFAERAYQEFPPSR